MSLLWFLLSAAGPETFSDISHDKGLAVDGIDLLVIVVVSSLHPPLPWLSPDKTRSEVPQFQLLPSVCYSQT